MATAAFNRVSTARNKERSELLFRLERARSAGPKQAQQEREQVYELPRIAYGGRIITPGFQPVEVEPLPRRRQVIYNRLRQWLQ